MTRFLCLAQAHASPKQPRSKSQRTGKDAAALPAAFTFLERVPVRLAAQKPVWDVLRKHASRQMIIDDAHKGDAFAADVVLIDRLGGEALASIASVLAERRAMALAAEKDAPASDILGKRLDRIFEQELEWLHVRNLLAGALRSGGRGGRRKPTRALLLIDA